MVQYHDAGQQLKNKIYLLEQAPVAEEVNRYVYWALLYFGKYNLDIKFDYGLV
jgi:hypothetical protein